MKATTTTLMAAIITLFLSITNNGLANARHVAPPDVTVEFASSADGGVQILPLSAQSPGVKMNAAAMANIAVTPVLLPAKTSPSWGMAADLVLTNAMMGTIPGFASVVTDPTMYSPSVFMLSWRNLVLSTSSPMTTMWNGTLNPGSQFANETGQVVWVLIDARSVSGGDDISLDMLTVSSASNDGGVLNSTIGFSGLTYTTRAFVVKADGTVITSGSTSQKGCRIMVLVLTKMFSGGATQAGLDQVRDYVNGFPVGATFPGYGVTFTGMIGTDSSSATVTLSGTSKIVQPITSLSRVNGLMVVNGEAGRSYRVLEEDTLSAVSGGWKFVALLQGTNSWPGALSGTNAFYRIQVQ